MVGPEFLYLIYVLKNPIFLHEVAPRSVFYGHHFIEEPERSWVYIAVVTNLSTNAATTNFFTFQGIYTQVASLIILKLFVKS